MSLQQQQADFARAVGKLITYAYSIGYALTLGDAWAHDGHSANSFHYKRLAIDLNLFKDNVWLQKTSDHAILGVYWEALGGTWGGRFSAPDGNHYSWGESRKPST